MKRNSVYTPILFAWIALAAYAADRPNIILAMADDQGYGDMGYTGHPVIQTPHFDAMSRAGLRFDHFYAAAPVCSPTRASVMTGRHPNRMGVFKWGHPIRPQEVTLAEALKTAGYATGHFGKWHLGSVRKGSPVNPGASGFDEWISAPNFYENDPILSNRGIAEQRAGESSLIPVDDALAFMERMVKADKPFLAVVWFGSPHGPHIASKKEAAKYAKYPDAQQNFYGEISGMDTAFGKLRDALGPLGIRDNTLLWYCSDNGGLKVESSGGRGRKGSVYEGGLRVPALLEWPARIKKPMVTRMRCNTTDIFPTLLEIVGVKRPDIPMDGISLVALLDGKQERREEGMGFWSYPGNGIRTPSNEWMAELLKAQAAGAEPEQPERLRLDAGKIKKQYESKVLPGHAAWISGDYKLHRMVKKGKVSWELYNLNDDMGETSDLVREQAERAAGMKKALTTWQQSVIDSLNGKDY
jgi:arylsulfatase A-like enzyme